MSAPDGTQLYPNVKDTNGNYFSLDQNNNVIDTLGRTPVTKTVNGTTTTYALLNSQGLRSSVTVTTTTISVSTAFGQSGVTEYSGTLTVIQKITLPDNTFYQFGYDSYGEINSITLPTGGQITYGYTNFQDSFGNKNRWATSRTSGGGTWNYTPQVISTCGSGQVGCQQNVTITKPSGDNAVYSFTLNNGAWESQVQHFTGAVSSLNLIATVTKAWDFSQGCQPTPCTGASNIRTLKLAMTLPTPVGSSTKKTELSYADTNTMNVSVVKEWKFYAGASPTFPANPDRETDLTFHGVFGNNIANRVLTSTTKDGGGNVLTQSSFTYDDSGALLNSSPATGITQHDDTNYGISNTVRGNFTKIRRCTVLSACSNNYVQTSVTYDTTGQPLSIQDPRGNTTNLSYADSLYKDVGDGPSNPPMTYAPTGPTNAYLTRVAPPLIPASTLSYYYGTGQIASLTDANAATSYSHFFDPFNRATSAVLPSGGWAYTAYAASETQVDSYLAITGAFTTSGCAGCRQDEVLLDNLARVTTQKLMSDPEGITSTATSYDTTGRVLNVAHPARPTPSTTDGIETPAYDALGRPIRVTHPDTTFSQTFYGAAVAGTGLGGLTSQLCTTANGYPLGYPTLFIDEAGKKKETWADGFGNPFEADEPDSTGNLTSATCYNYDLLGNLTQVVHGTQTRTYAYDALSRVTSVSIPEISNAPGTQCAVTFTYDANSNVQTRTAPAPNQNASCTNTVTVTYSYDALNRLTGKTYSDSTPAVKYGYDGAALTGCTTTPPALMDANPKGRMTAMCDSSGATSWAHDAAGRILAEKRTILGVTETISYSYNLDGSVATITYPSAKVVTYGVNNAQRLTTAKDLASSTQFAIAASYAPPGGLNGIITGQISGGFTGVTESHTYNSSLEYTSTRATSTAGTALDLSLSYNLPGGDNGTVTGITNNADAGRTQSFTYDPLNRILSAKSSATSGADCWGQNFGPDGTISDDAVGNLNKMNSGTQTAPPCPFGRLDVTVDGNNHINSSTSFVYDAAGNMLQDGSGLTYTFDDENHLTLASGMTGGPYCYVYDGNGLRVAKKSNSNSSCTGGTVLKLYWRSIAGDALAETDGTGSTTNSAYNEYVFFAGRRIASRDGTGNIFYYFADHLGSTRTITTGSGPGQTPGQLCSDADFTPYGQEISHTERLQTSACPPNYKFTGYERDTETGLDYAFARYYSSRLGRFLSTDPLGGAIGAPQSHNAYAYVTNNPLNLVDPSGMDDTACIVEPCGSDGGGGGGRCTLDGIDVPCGIVARLADAGGVAVCLNPPTCTAQIPLSPLIYGSGVFYATAQLGFAAPAYPCPYGDCRVSPPWVEVWKTLSFWITIYMIRNNGQTGGNTSGGGGSTPDDRAKALADAINRTGVQSLGNPCTLVAFYGASAIGGALGNLAAGGEVATQGGEALLTYWPQALSQVSNWLYRQSMRGGTVANFILNLPKNYNKARAGVLGACNAMQ